MASRNVLSATAPTRVTAHLRRALTTRTIRWPYGPGAQLARYARSRRSLLHALGADAYVGGVDLAHEQILERLAPRRERHDMLARAQRLAQRNVDVGLG